MASASKRKSDKARGKSGKYTAYWKGADGSPCSRVAYVDYERSLALANRMEAEAAAVRDGLVDVGDRARRKAAQSTIVSHVDDYCRSLEADEDTPKHVKDVRVALLRLLKMAAVDTVADLAPDRIKEALARLRTELGLSARSRNKSCGYVKSFATWLREVNRILEVPRGLASIKKLDEKTDPRYVRRILTKDQLDLLLACTEKGPDFVATRGKRCGPRPVVSISGPERAAVYRLAMGTGFRAKEIRTLTAGRFDLEGDRPTVTVLAAYAKNDKTALQPIHPELAAALKPFVDGKPPGEPIVTVPKRTANMLRRDLVAAGIDPGTGKDGVIDFHALRHSYVTHLVNSGVNPKVVQKLARHSTIALTLDLYTHVEDDDLRKAINEKG